jgi:methylmalonyl-CoA/ethylmalonyl-CoA epimerase
MFKGLDHIAIAVPDTETALKTWRDKFGFKVLFAEKVNNETALLTHLDLGNTHLQLVQPLTPDSPLHAWLEENGGPGLHHFCLLVDDVGETLDGVKEMGIGAMAKIHQGTRGKRALFLDKATTDNVQVEITGK